MVRGVKIIEDKLQVVTVSDDGLIKFFDVDKEQQYLNLKEHNGAVTCLDIHPKENHFVITGGIDKTVRIWDLRQKATAIKYEMDS